MNEELLDDMKMVADIKKSRFQHKLSPSETKNIAENKIIALQHREILSESTVNIHIITFQGQSQWSVI